MIKGKFVVEKDDFEVKEVLAEGNGRKLIAEVGNLGFNMLTTLLPRIVNDTTKGMNRVSKLRIEQTTLQIVITQLKNRVEELENQINSELDEEETLENIIKENIINQIKKAARKEN